MIPEYRDTGMIEFRFADGEANSMTFSGYASTFGGAPDSYGDVIAAGAFADAATDASSGTAWPAMLFNHSFDGAAPIGVWTTLREDQRGLYVEGRLADTERGREVYGLLKMQPRPAIDGLSIGFSVKESTIGTKPSEPRRTLKKLVLHEISIVTFPANTRARVAHVKAEEKFKPSTVEQILRSAGFSRREAAAIVRAGVKAAADALAGTDYRTVDDLVGALNAAKSLFHETRRP